MNPKAIIVNYYCGATNEMAQQRTEVIHPMTIPEAREMAEQVTYHGFWCGNVFVAPAAVMSVEIEMEA